MNCPCESGQTYSECCEPIHTGALEAPTAEALMRARYSAILQNNMDFISDSHDPRTRYDFDLKATREWAEQTQWLGLEILETEAGGEEDQRGWVEFKAYFQGKEGKEAHHELSEFNRRKGKWYFSKAKAPRSKTHVHEGEKVGRNDPCPCGSGKKYKKCCGVN